MKQTAVGWIIDQLFELRNPTLNQIEIVKKAREMEKQQQDEFAIGFVEWCDNNYFRMGNTSFWAESMDWDNDTKFTTKELLEIYKKEKGL